MVEYRVTVKLEQDIDVNVKGEDEEYAKRKAIADFILSCMSPRWVEIHVKAEIEEAERG